MSEQFNSKSLQLSLPSLDLPAFLQVLPLAVAGENLPLVCEHGAPSNLVSMSKVTSANFSKLNLTTGAKLSFFC